MKPNLHAIMIGSTGAVGGHVAATLANHPEVARLTLLGRRPTEIEGSTIAQHTVDILEPTSYKEHITGHNAAICTLGVGDPSTVDKATFVRIDKDAVLDFATQCKEAGVRHFSLLSSVSVSSSSFSFYLRTKGELEDGLRSLNFDRLSLIHPSMILTPQNRYGLSQALFLKVWPLLRPVLVGPTRKFRGIPVKTLGQAIALNTLTQGSGEETLEWDDFIKLTG